MKVFCLILIFSFLGGNCLAAETVREKRIEKEFDPRGKIVLKNHNRGSINIKAGSSSKVEISGYLIVEGTDQTELRTFYEEVDLCAAKKEEKIILKIKIPDYISPGIEFEFNLEINLPENENIEINSRAGRIILSGVCGEVEINAHRAILEVENGCGKLIARGLKRALLAGFTGEIIELEGEEIEFID